MTFLPATKEGGNVSVYLFARLYSKSYKRILIKKIALIEAWSKDFRFLSRSVSVIGTTFAYYVILVIDMRKLVAYIWSLVSIHRLVLFFSDVILWFAGSFCCFLCPSSGHGPSLWHGCQRWRGLCILLPTCFVLLARSCWCIACMLCVVLCWVIVCVYGVLLFAVLRSCSRRVWCSAPGPPGNDRSEHGAPPGETDQTSSSRPRRWRRVDVDSQTENQLHVGPAAPSTPVLRRLSLHRRPSASQHLRRSRPHRNAGRLGRVVVSALGMRTRRPRFESRVAPLFHWVAILGKLSTHIASPVSQLQETGVQKGVFGA